MKEIFPNAIRVLSILLTTGGTSASVERANSTLRHFRLLQYDGEERLIASLLVYIHRDIFLDYDKIIGMYGSKYPRRMLLINPLSERINPIQDGGQKGPSPTNFFAATFTNVGISSEIFLTFSFNPFATLV